MESSHGEAARRVVVERWWHRTWPLSVVRRRRRVGSDRRLAVLIDVENSHHRLVEPLVQVLQREGRLDIRRAYGDWSSPGLSRWRQPLADQGFLAVQQSRHAGRKNSSDVALVVDAMDLLHSGRVDGFCIVSSDSDFTRLAVRIREQGLWLMVCGRRDTPRALMMACSQFVAVEELEPSGKVVVAAAVKRVAPTARPPLEVVEVLLRVWEAAAEDNGGDRQAGVALSVLGQRLHEQLPGFDPRVYGFRQLTHLVQGTGLFVLRTSRTDQGTAVRVHRRAQPVIPAPEAG